MLSASKTLAEVLANTNVAPLDCLEIRQTASIRGGWTVWTGHESPTSRIPFLCRNRQRSREIRVMRE